MHHNYFIFTHLRKALFFSKICKILQKINSGTRLHQIIHSNMPEIDYNWQNRPASAGRAICRHSRGNCPFVRSMSTPI